MLTYREEQNFEPFIQDGFGNDQVLLDNWHVDAGKGKDICVARTIEDIKNFDKSFRFFALYDEQKNIGFFGTEFGNFLSTLFLKPEYRTKENKEQLWNMIHKELSNPFFSAIYKKNTPCHKFFMKHQGIIIEEAVYKNNDYRVYRFGEF